MLTGYVLIGRDHRGVFDRVCVLIVPPWVGDAINYFGAKRRDRPYDL